MVYLKTESDGSINNQWCKYYVSLPRGK